MTGCMQELRTPLLVSHVHNTLEPATRQHPRICKHVQASGLPQGLNVSVAGEGDARSAPVGQAGQRYCRRDAASMLATCTQYAYMSAAGRAREIVGVANLAKAGMQLGRLIFHIVQASPSWPWLDGWEQPQHTAGHSRSEQN